MESTSRVPCITPCRRKQLVTKSAWSKIRSWARNVNSRDRDETLVRLETETTCLLSRSTMSRVITWHKSKLTSQQTRQSCEEKFFSKTKAETKTLSSTTSPQPNAPKTQPHRDVCAGGSTVHLRCLVNKVMSSPRGKVVLSCWTTS